MAAKRGPRPRGLLRGLGGRRAGGEAGLNSGASTDIGGASTDIGADTLNSGVVDEPDTSVGVSLNVNASARSVQWKLNAGSQSSDRSTSGRGGRPLRGYPRSFRSADRAAGDKSSSFEVGCASGLSFNRVNDSENQSQRRGSHQRGRGGHRFPRGTWGGIPGRSEDRHWRQHDDRRNDDAVSSRDDDAVSNAQRISGRPNHAAADPHLSPAAPVFVPQSGSAAVPAAVVPASAGSATPTGAAPPVLGPFSFIAMTPSGQPVTMVLQPAATQVAGDPPNVGQLTPQQKSVMAAMAAVVPPQPVATDASSTPNLTIQTATPGSMPQMSGIFALTSPNASQATAAWVVKDNSKKIVPRESRKVTLEPRGPPQPPSLQKSAPSTPLVARAAPVDGQPALWKDRVPAALEGLPGASGQTGFPPQKGTETTTRRVPEKENPKGEVAETKVVVSPRDKFPGYSRVTHRGGAGAHVENVKKIDSTVRTPKGKVSADAVGVLDSRRTATNQAAKLGAPPPPPSSKKIAVRGERKIQASMKGGSAAKNQTSPSGFFSNPDKDFPALDKKLNELKLEAEARETKPITWRKSRDPLGDNEGESKPPPKHSYAARLKGVRFHVKSPPAARGNAEGTGVPAAGKAGDDDWWVADDESSADKKKEITSVAAETPVKEGEIFDAAMTDADEATAAKSRRRRRRRRRKPADQTGVNEEDVDENVLADTITGTTKKVAGSDGRSVVVESGALRVRFDNDVIDEKNAETTTTTTSISDFAKEPSPVAAAETENIFKEDDFPDFLVDFRRGLSAAAAAATRKIPRVIGSKVTKLGAGGKPLPKTVNEWTDVASDDINNVTEESTSIGSTRNAATSTAPSVWGGAASRSFAEALRMAASVVAAPVPAQSNTSSAKAVEAGEVPAKRKRKRKKKAKSEEAAASIPPQLMKKSKAPMTFDLSALVSKKSGAQPQSKKKAPAKKNLPEPTPGIRLRGKEREKPKKKRPSKMRRVILSERQLRGQRRELLFQLQAALHAPHAQFVAGTRDAETADVKEGSNDALGAAPATASVKIAAVDKDDWLTTDAESDDEIEGANEAVNPVGAKAGTPGSEGEVGVEARADSRRVNGHLTTNESKALTDFESLDRSQLEAKVAENLKEMKGERIKHWGPKALHNRKFREYCTHFIDADLNALVKSLMVELMRFQDKIYHKEKEASVNMFKTKRRFFNGLREVLKYVKLRKIKLLLVASDVESIQSSGGLDEVMDQILQEAKSQNVFTVFTMSRFALGKMMKKPVPVSCVGVKDYSGCEAIVKQLKTKVEEKTREYEEKLAEVEAPEGGVGRGATEEQMVEG